MSKDKIFSGLILCLSLPMLLCSTAMTGCGGHHSHEAEPDDPDVKIYELADGTEIRINDFDVSLRFVKPIFDSRWVLNGIAEGKVNGGQADPDLLSEYRDLYFDTLNIKSDTRNQPESEEIPIHSVFTGRLSYSLSAVKNEQETDQTGYRLVARSAVTDVQGVLPVTDFKLAGGDGLFAGFTRHALITNERVPLTVELCIADQNMNILKNRDDHDACLVQNYEIETNAYGFYKIALSDDFSCGLNRMGDVYCWGAGEFNPDEKDDEGDETGWIALVEASLNMSHRFMGADYDGDSDCRSPYQCRDTAVSPSLVRDSVNGDEKDLHFKPLRARLEDGYEVDDISLVSTSDGNFLLVNAGGWYAAYSDFSIIRQDEEMIWEHNTSLSLVPVIFAGVHHATVSASVMTMVTHEGEVVMIGQEPDTNVDYSDRIVGIFRMNDFLELGKPKSSRIYTSGMYTCAVMDRSGEGGVNCFGELGYPADGDGGYIMSDNSAFYQGVMITGDLAGEEDQVFTASGDLAEVAAVLNDGTLHPVHIGKVALSDLAVCVSTQRSRDYGGNLYCWGRNAVPVGAEGENSPFGLLGLGADSQLFYHHPQAVEEFADSRIKDFDVSHDHMCAVKDDGRVYCWGSRVSLKGGSDELLVKNYDKLGIGGIEDFVSSPVAVENLSSVEKVAAGRYRSCVVDSRAEAYCFGKNEAGELGNGTNESSTVPVAVVYNPIRYEKCVYDGHSFEICDPREMPAEE